MTRREQIVNHVATTVDGAINDSVTSITLADGSIYPAEGDYRLRIDTEVVLVTARATNVVTVVRGADGTAAASHSDLATVDVIITQNGLDAYIDHVIGGSSARPACVLQDSAGVSLTASDFSWINQGTDTLTDEADGSLTYLSAVTTGSYSMITRSVTAPWTLTVGFQFSGMSWDSTLFSIMGIHAMNSSDRFLLNRFESGADYRVSEYNSFSSFNSHKITTPFYGTGTTVWMQIEDDNVDLIHRISRDGINWWEAYNAGRAVDIGGGANRAGFALHARGPAGKTVHIKSWIEL